MGIRNLIARGVAPHVAEQIDSAYSSGGGSADLAPYCCTGSGSDIPNTATTQTLSTERVSDSNYSLSSNEVTVTAAGTYLISYGILIDEDGTAGGTRGRAEAWVEADTVEITASRNGVYVREASGGSGISNTFVASLSASDVVRLRAQTTQGNVDISSQLSQLSLVKLA